MNKNIVYGLGIALVLLGAVFYAGYAQGRKDTVVTMKANALVIANCTDIRPPNDRTFGSTTLGIINCATQYKKCQTACLGS